MKQQLKHFLLTALVALCSITAFAHDFEVDGICYNYNNDGTSVSVTYRGSYYSSYVNEYTGTVTIPSSVTYNGQTYRVTSIGYSAFSGCSGLTSVTIPNSVTSIGDSAFSGCSGLTSVTIPNSVTSIENSAFSGCSGLTSFTGKFASEDNRCLIVDGVLKAFVPAGLTSYSIPSTVTSIGRYAFYGCYDLTSVTIPGSVTSIEDFVFYGCSSLTTVNFNATKCTYMGDYNDMVFYNCPALQTLNIGDNVTVIPDYVFCGCSGLTSVTIPNSVTSIGDWAFCGCSGLTSVTIPNSVTSIGDYVFCACSGLTSVTIPNSVTSIGDYAFHDCSGLTSVTIGNSVASIGDYAFAYCSDLTSVTIGNSVASIGDGAFSECSGLTSVTIGNSVTSIGGEVFRGCSGLTTVNFNATKCTSMGGLYSPVFSNCPSLQTLTIGDNVTVIPNYAFRGCLSLTSVTIGNSVTSIGRSAFSGCRGLTSVTIPNSVTSIGLDAFANCSGLTSVTIGNSVTSIGSYAFSGCIGLTSVTIPNSVTSIGGNAFGYCSGLASVTIPNSVVSIGNYAFSNCCGLTSATIGNSVTSIGEYAFSGCSGLTSVTIPNSVESIGNSAFYDCSGLTSVIIGNSVESIGEWAFEGCSGLIRIIILPSTVSIEWNAFSTGSIPVGRVTYIRNSNITNDYFGTTVVCSNQIFTVDDFTYMITDVSAKTCSMISYDGNDTDVAVPAKVLYNGRVELTVTGVGQSAFARNNTVQSIAFNNSGSIGAYACNDCSALQSVSVGNNATTVGNYAFNGCAALTSLTIGSGITSIGNNVLDGTTSLTVVDVAEGNTTYCDLDGVICSKDGTRIVVAPKGITSYTIPNCVTNIADYAFQYCTALTGIEVHANVTSIGQYAFDGCCNLETANINASGSIGDYAFWNIDLLSNVTILNATSIGKSAFAGASKLTELRIPHSVTSIGESAFSGCSSLETLYLGEHLNTIGKQAFLNCTKLETITSTNVTPPTCASEAFSGVDGTLCEVNVRDEAVDAYSVANGWKDFWFLQGYTINYIEKQPTSDDVSVVMHNTKEEVTYQWYSDAGSIISGSTDAELDLSTLSNINKVFCIVTLSDGIQLKSDVVEVSTEAKPTYSVASYKGNSSTENSTLDIDQIKGLTLQDNEMVYVDANIGTVMPTNIVKKNGEGNWVATQIELTDGQPFYNPSDVLAEVISYTRDFTTANWQALYVPFDVQYEDWADKADVAYINDVHQFDDDEDGRVERTVIEYLYKKSGTISANKPYLIRPKQTGEMTLTSRNATLKATPATGGSVDCSSTTMLYTLTGTYQTITNMYDKHWYALSDGALRQASHSGVTLAPFRFYLNITDRNGNPVSDIDRPSYVRLMIGGLMIDEETGVEVPDANTSNADGRVYDLQGRRVEHPKHGLYIIDGKKTIIK